MLRAGGCGLDRDVGETFEMLRRGSLLGVGAVKRSCGSEVCRDTPFAALPGWTGRYDDPGGRLVGSRRAGRMQEAFDPRDAGDEPHAGDEHDQAADEERGRVDGRGRL